MVRVVAHALLLVRHCACVEFPGRGNASCDGAPLRVTSLALAGRHLELGIPRSARGPGRMDIRCGERLDCTRFRDSFQRLSSPPYQL
jgi:hypothetical protein